MSDTNLFLAGFSVSGVAVAAILSVIWQIKSMADRDDEPSN